MGRLGALLRPNLAILRRIATCGRSLRYVLYSGVVGEGGMVQGDFSTPLRCARNDRRGDVLVRSLPADWDFLVGW